MQHSENYTIENLVDDPSFRDWVYEREQENSNQWGNIYLETFESNQSVIEQAREFLLAIKGEQEGISSEEATNQIQQILEQADNTPIFKSRNLFQFKTRWMSIAASVLLVFGIGLLVWTKLPSNTSTKTYQSLKEQSDINLTEIVNDSDKPRLVNLSDGSSIILQKNSRISFPKVFSSNKREVYLSGEAFFEVSKNPSQPFFVYANELVAKVLGTSFSIRAYETDKEVKVVVKTGRVSVFSQTDARSTTLRNNRELSGLVLTPNQQIVFQRDEVRMVRELVEKPELLNIPIERQTFVFKRSSLVEVFNTLEKAYGVDIVYDEDLMSECSITASLTDEPLFEKLQMICAAVEASYEEMDGQIVISSKGCK
jgi:transmembrane sensor